MITLKQIKDEYIKELGYDFAIKSRKRHIVYARYCYYKTARMITDEILENIGAQVQRDHATVLNGLFKFDNDVTNYEPEFMKVYKKVTKKLRMYTKTVCSDIIVIDVDLLNGVIFYGDKK